MFISISHTSKFESIIKSRPKISKLLLSLEGSIPPEHALIASVAITFIFLYIVS